MFRVALGWLLVLLVPSALALPSRAADVSTSPGRSIVFETRHFDDAPIDGSIVTAQLRKGKKKHVLTVSATVVTTLPTSGQQNVAAALIVNGLPVPSSVSHNCDIGNSCTVTGVWILDLDQAELEHPGVYLKQPLDIQLILQDGFANTAQTIDITLIARLEKKK